MLYETWREIYHYCRYWTFYLLPFIPPGSLSLPLTSFSSHICIPRLLRHWIPCLLWHFFLFLCICLTSYSLLMYLSHFLKQRCQKLSQRARLDCFYRNNGKFNKSLRESELGWAPISSPLISFALICSPSREGEEAKQGTRDMRPRACVWVCVGMCWGKERMWAWEW